MPAFERGDGDGGVQEGGNRDADDVETTVRDEVRRVAVEALDAVLLAEFGSGAVLHPGDGDELHAREVVVGGHVLLAGPAETDDSGAEGALEAFASGDLGDLRAHGTPFGFCVRIDSIVDEWRGCSGMRPVERNRDRAVPASGSSARWMTIMAAPIAPPVSPERDSVMVRCCVASGVDR